MQPTPEQRFWSKVRKTPKCWLWIGPRNGDYGRPWYAGKRIYAHRLAWLLTHGCLKKCILHKCDTPLCVRPSHLFVGTRRDNNRDMAAKGRHWEQRIMRCPHGHRYTEDNTYIGWQRGTPHRHCRRCHNWRTLQHWRKKHGLFR